MMKVLRSWLYLGFTVTQTVQAQNLITSDEAWTQINLKVTDELVIPAYESLQTASIDLQEASVNFCKLPAADSLRQLQAAYLSMMDTWQSIQHIQFGPITYFNWNFRIQYWPDERGTSGRQLDAVISAANPGILNTDSFSRQSVGIQGLQALERLLYADMALSDYQNNDYLCPLTEMIAININEISSGVLERWLDEYRQVVIQPDSGGVFEDAEDLSIEFLKALQESLSKIRDQKLLPIIGENYSRVRPRNAESWRSQHSLANIKTNIKALQALFMAYMEAFYTDDVEAIIIAFEALNTTLAEAPDNMTSAQGSEVNYERLQTVHAQIDTLHEAFENALKQTDLYLGFNSLDGD
jgi:predicted lipoprotein